MVTPVDKCETAQEGLISQVRHRPKHRRARLIALTVAVMLPLLRINRVFGDESEIGYRKSYYLEDDNRIKVSTDTWQFDVGLNDHVRVTGDVVVDAISGATPLGAPPQTKWPFPTFNYFYQPIYRGLYGAPYSQFIQNNQIYVDAGLETMQQLTNDAAFYAHNIAGLLATNSAFASLRSLATNANDCLDLEKRMAGLGDELNTLPGIEAKLEEYAGAKGDEKRIQTEAATTEMATCIVVAFW